MKFPLWAKIMLAFGLAMLLLILFAVWTLMSNVRNGYEVVDGSVYYRYFNNTNWKVERREVKGAATDFQTIRGSGGRYGTDGQSVFHEGNILTAADPKTFQVLDWREDFSRDANHAYWTSIKISDDPSHFEVLTRGYARDRENVYYASRIVDGAIPSSFVVDGTSTSHAHDENHRYNMGRKAD